MMQGLRMIRQAADWTGMTAASPGEGGLVSRRAVLGGLGITALGAALGGTGAYLYDDHRHATGSTRLDVAGWRRIRGNRYYIGHRGAGDVRPEHTMPAYQAAADWGARALEISTSSTSDSVMVCMHDLTLDRTTDGTGAVHDKTWQQLTKLGVRQPQLGPAWTRQPLTPIPRLEQVLETFGGRLVLCIEAKRYEDYPLLIDLIEKHGLQKSVIIKAFHLSNAIADAKGAGYPVFSYFGVPDVSPDAIGTAARVLDPKTDYLVLPSTYGPKGDSVLPEAYMRAAVRTGVPVWVYPIHRRSEADYFFGLGASGLVTSSYRYVTTRTPSTRFDTWNTKAVASGEMNMLPDEKTFAAQWTGEAELTLAKRDTQHFITLGQFGPLPNAGGSYQVDLQVRWNLLPHDTTTNVTLAFGHADDRYYEEGLGASDGYHAVLTANGSLELYVHRAGQQVGERLGSPVQTIAPEEGQWIALRLNVFPQGITWTRLDASSPETGSAAQVSVEDRRFRGGYLHIGRTATDKSSVSFRSLTVS
jgi:glycerophosphoryl diester phosphodiesterase